MRTDFLENIIIMKMKFWKIIVLFLFPVMLIGCGPNPSDPKALLKEANLDLPDYTVALQGDNLERGASAWDCYDYKLKLNKPIDDSFINQLKELVKTDSNWTYNAEHNLYEYHNIQNDSYDLAIYVDIATSEVQISYMEYSLLS